MYRYTYVCMCVYIYIYIQVACMRLVCIQRSSSTMLDTICSTRFRLFSTPCHNKHNNSNSNNELNDNNNGTTNDTNNNNQCNKHNDNSDACHQRLRYEDVMPISCMLDTYLIITHTYNYHILVYASFK